MSTPLERFAHETDALLAGQEPLLPADQATPELALARRLHTAAAAGVPDPAFVAGLREELRAAALARQAAPGVSLRYATLDTELGPLGIAYREGKVVYCALFESEAAFTRLVTRALGSRPEREEALPERLERGIREHLAGRRRFTDVDLSWLTPFQRRVLEKTAEIPRGELRPYGWVAKEIGSPGAVRAVGTALGHNPIPFIIPCHRVVRSDGTLGEYSASGPAMKEKVLRFEGVPVGDLLAGVRRGEVYRASRTTHIVCYPTCHAARRIQPANVVPFTSLRAAEAEGYRPCKLCRPA